MGLNFEIALGFGHAVAKMDLKNPKVICLGYPTNNINADKAKQLCAHLGLDVAIPEILNTESVLKMLGAGSVKAIDLNNNEGAEILMDLSRDSLAKELQGAADIVLDVGTMEHIPNPGFAMQTVHALLKPGGLAMHINPTNGHVDHGFWQISPTFYNDWYRCNDYKVVFSSFSHVDVKTPSVFIEPYEMDLYRNLSKYELKSRYGFGYVLFCAEKTENSPRECRFPVQSFYKKRYEGNDYGYGQLHPLTYRKMYGQTETLIRNAIPKDVKDKIRKVIK